jgi:hypothetical protein
MCRTIPPRVALIWGIGLFVAACSSSAKDLDTGVAADAGRTADASARMDASAAADASLPTDAQPEDSASADATFADSGSPADGTPGSDAASTDASETCPIGIDETITATLRVSADDDRRVFVNEVMVDDLTPSRTWGTITTTTVRLFRHPSRANVIAVLAKNYLSIDGLDRGLLLDVTSSSTSAAPLLTDASWRVRSSTVAGYETIAFDDSQWSQATEEVMHPGGPYGAIFGTSSAWWIWTYDAAIPASMKPIEESMAARRRFYVLRSGAFSDAPGSCP